MRSVKNSFNINGNKINSLEEFYKELEKIDESKFNTIKQGICSWIKTEVGDTTLARRINNLKYKENIIKTIKKRVEYLKKIEQCLEKDKIQVGLDLYVNSVKLVLDKEKCIRCGVSHTVCPKEAVTLEGEKIEVEKDKCVLCGLCVPFCPTGALEIFVDGNPEQLVYKNESLPELPDFEIINETKIKRLFTGSITIDESKCPEKCEECVVACPINVIEREGKKVIVDRDKCVLCGACKHACPEEAIEIKRNRILTKEKKGFSASWTEVIDKLLGTEKVNLGLNAGSMEKMIDIVKGSKELTKYTK
ncbi:4Fe-4S binding protein [Candidatus Woesearchaeota archaeon]|nr:4Fe-4S binding protein [Candidatus Woesearchaeota archaeon]